MPWLAKDWRYTKKRNPKISAKRVSTTYAMGEAK
jgi:hypothetical protein